PLSFGFTRYKNGVNPFDYTSWINASIQPVEKNGIFSLPIIVLADNYSISLAEATTMAIKAMPNSTFIGETTWGATGPITSNQLYNDGQF
ncbi:S41 family peptidase, partial [Acinetobacter baumannii]